MLIQEPFYTQSNGLQRFTWFLMTFDLFIFHPMFVNVSSISKRSSLLLKVTTCIYVSKSYFFFVLSQIIWLYAVILTSYLNSSYLFPTGQTRPTNLTNSPTPIQPFPASVLSLSLTSFSHGWEKTHCGRHEGASESGHLVITRRK